MIEKNKLYLCVGIYVKTQEEAEMEKLRNQFIDTYYHSVTSSYSMTMDGNVFLIPSYTEWKPNPVFFIGQYYMSYADNYLTDALSNQIEITEENYHNFVEFNYEITAEAQRRIDIMREKGITVSISPVAVMKEGTKKTPTYSLDDFIIKWNVWMSLLKLGNRSIYASATVNEVETQEDGILKAWKKLRLRSSLTCRVKNCIIRPKSINFGPLRRIGMRADGTYFITDSDNV
jgi:hypothetical protein